MHYKILKYQLPIIFMALLILPAINGYFNILKFDKNNENRNFSNSIKVDLGRLDYYLPKEFNTYVNDNFSFRTPLLNIYNRIKFSIFKISPYSEKTIIGKDDWYFMAGKEKDIYQGRANLSEKSKHKLLNEWIRRNDYLDSMDIKCYWVIAPMKHYVYSDKLPGIFYKANSRRVDNLAEYFKDDLPNLILDPLSTMLKDKDSTKLYYKLDNHWNFRSGYLTSEILLERIKKDFPNLDIGDMPKTNWTDSLTQAGFHYEVLGNSKLFEIRQEAQIEEQYAVLTEKVGFPILKEFPYPDEYEIRYTSSKSKTPLKVLFIRDSFAIQMMPFLVELFKDCTFIFDAWQYKMNESIVEELKPDVVVFIGLETHIDNILDNI